MIDCLPASGFSRTDTVSLFLPWDYCWPPEFPDAPNVDRLGQDAPAC